MSGFVPESETASEFNAFIQGQHAILDGLICSPSRTSMKHEDIRWNRINGEWFCAKCGRVSAHMVKEEAQAELEKYECNLPAVDPRKIKTSG